MPYKEASKQYEWVKRAREKKRKQLQELKTGKSCKKCKQLFPHYVMHWHHRNKEEKEFEISRAVRDNISWIKIMLEISKCDLYCANCHSIVEWQERYGLEE